jgi:hypothetical protein
VAFLLSGARAEHVIGAICLTVYTYALFLYLRSKDTRSGCLIRRTAKNRPRSASNAKQKPDHQCGTPGLSRAAARESHSAAVVCRPA